MLRRTTLLLLSTRASALALSSRAYRAPVNRDARVSRIRAGEQLNDQGVTYRVKKSSDEWQQELVGEAYYVLRQKGTERPGTGEYNKFYPTEGHFVCAAPSCAQPLYSAQAKFDSGCGWPAFDKIVKGAVVTATDNTLGMKRVEILCSGCGGHLGHVFEGEGFTPTMERHCVNSLSMKYMPGPLTADAEEEKVLPPFENPMEKAKGLLGELFGNK